MHVWELAPKIILFRLPLDLHQLATIWLSFPRQTATVLDPEVARLEERQEALLRRLAELEQEVDTLSQQCVTRDSPRAEDIASVPVSVMATLSTLIMLLNVVRIRIRNIYSVIFQTQETSAKTISGRCRRGHLVTVVQVSWQLQLHYT